MGILSKQKSKSMEENNELEVNQPKEEQKHESYVAYLNENKKKEEAKIQAKITEFELKYNEKLGEYLNRSDVKEARKGCIERHEPFNINEPELVSLYSIIGKYKKQLNGIELKNSIDLQLLILANRIDSADFKNEAVSIMQTIIPKFEALISDFNMAMHLYSKADGGVPGAIRDIGTSMQYLINAFHSGQVDMITIDKEKLIKEFNERLVIVAQETRKKEKNEELKKQLEEITASIK